MCIHIYIYPAVVSLAQARARGCVHRNAVKWESRCRAAKLARPGGRNRARPKTYAQHRLSACKQQQGAMH
eukprot:6307685-Lingulodinium_polyedra.AAC.1